MIIIVNFNFYRCLMAIADLSPREESGKSSKGILLPKFLASPLNTLDLMILSGILITWMPMLQAYIGLR